MQQTADVEILWITVDVAAECLPAYGSFFSSAAVADSDAVATDADVEMTAACGSSFSSAAVADSETDAMAAVDVEMAVVTAATVDVVANYKNQIIFCQTNRGGETYISASFYALPDNSFSVFCYVLFSRFVDCFSFSFSFSFFFLMHSSSTS